MIEPGEAFMVMGPSGTGKSTLARNAMIAEKSGAVLLAPGPDEWASYSDLPDDRFAKHICNDVPVALNWLNKVFKANHKHLKEHGVPLHRVLAFDTLSGLDQMLQLFHMQQCAVEKVPSPRSPKGGEYYGGIKNTWTQFMARGRAIRGLGIHWIGLVHAYGALTQEGVSMEGTGLEEPETVQPLITGKARVFVPAAFDLVLHSGIKNIGGQETFVLQWKSDPKKVTKSRYGSLAKNDIIHSDWTKTLELITLAKERRRVEMEEMLA